VRRSAGWAVLVIGLVASGLVLVFVLVADDSRPRRPVDTSSPEPPRSEPGRPDIVLILTDDQRWDTLWAMPTVQQLLVRHGVTFSNAFVVNSLCCPSRTSILTGDYSHTTGVYANLGPHGGFPVFDDGSTLATWLDAAGYDTGLFGKYLNLYPGRYVPPGWDSWTAFVMDPDVARHYYDYTVSEGTTVRGYGDAPGDYSTNVLADDAVGFIRSARGPMFLYFAPWAPHAPPIAAPGDEDTFANLKPARPPNFDEADVADKPRYVRRNPSFDRRGLQAVDSVRRGQYQTLVAVDRAVGRIVAALRETGRLDNTLIVFTSDNGFAWGEHRWTAKQTPYEEAIRVPLVISFPPLTPIARTEQRMALNIDLAPTIAELTGVDDHDPDGRSLVPIIAGAKETAWRDSFLIEHAHVFARPAPPSYCAVRTEDRLFVAYSTGEREYYDLSADPYELENRADDPRTRAAQAPLRARLHELCNPPPPGMSRP
jgi:N-acetylglucosamine-6-sulfatase